MEEVENEEAQAKRAAKQKKLAGVPTFDPDALPSTQCTKYMPLDCPRYPPTCPGICRTSLGARIKKTGEVRKKFEDCNNKTDVQTRSIVCSLVPEPLPRILNGLTEMCQRLEDIHSQIGSEYSKGIVRGYTKELLGECLFSF